MVTEANYTDPLDKDGERVSNILNRLDGDPKITVKDVTDEIFRIVRGTSLSEVERLYIIRVLDANSGNKTKTAFELGITIKTLYNKLHEYGLFEKYQTQKKKDEVTVNEQ